MRKRVTKNNKMVTQTHKLVFTLIIFLSLSRAKIIRNNALMTKMVSNYQRDNDVSEPDAEKQPVLMRMQNLLCKNFPTIPCEMITQDKKLKKLIEKSIQQINYKKLSLEKTTSYPGYLTLFPIINNENLSNFLQSHDPYVQDIHKKTKNIVTKAKEKTIEKHRIKTKSKRTSVYNRKKLRKFYPHKVKYRDKNTRTVKDDFGDNTGEKLSMSVEIPDMTLTRKHQHYSYKVAPDDPPVWRIDYMKHGEPSINMFGDKFKEKITKTGPSVVVDNMEHTRRDVLHPDVIIKKNYLRKNQDNTDIE